MNNEEKILAMLEEMKSAQEEMKAAQAEMRADISEMQTTLTRVAVTQEGVVLPRLQLLYEGQVNLQQTLAPKDRVRALEGDVAMLKDVVKLMRMEIEELKQAQ